LPTNQTALTDKVIYDPRPVVETDGERNAMVQQLLVGMDVRSQEGGLSSVELRFRNTATFADQGNDYAFEGADNDSLSLGKPITILTGDRGDLQEIFRGTITAIEFINESSQQPELVVLAEDDLLKARLSRKTRLFTDSTAGDIVESIAQELGLSADVSGLDESLDSWLQHNETDLAFLRRLLARFDADMQLLEGTLQVSPRTDVQRGELTLRMRSQLLAVKICADLNHQVTGVSLAHWDPGQGQTIEAESDQSADAGPGEGTSGADALDAAVGSRVEHLSGVAVANQSEAQAVVNASFARRSRRFVTVNGVAIGNPAIKVGTHVTLEAVGPRFANTYYVTRVLHRYDRSARLYQTEFEAECGFLGEAN
jgi:phage protein D